MPCDAVMLVAHIFSYPTCACICQLLTGSGRRTYVARYWQNTAWLHTPNHLFTL